MATNTSLVMRKAAMLLDKGRTDDCVKYLSDKISESEREDNNAALIIFLVAQGELLIELGRMEEGTELLRRALTLEPFDRDLVAYERRRAEELLRGH